MVQTSADEKVRTASHYLWKKFFPKSVKTYVEMREVTSAKEAGEVAEMNEIESYVDVKLEQFTEAVDGQLTDLQFSVQWLCYVAMLTVVTICSVCPLVCCLRRREHI